MQQPIRPQLASECPSSTTNAIREQACPRDEPKAAARIPDSVAALSYGTRPLAGPGLGPRLF
jgi:hypothetical protein